MHTTSRRADARIRQMVPIKYSLYGIDHFEESQTLNTSRSGLCFMPRRPLAVDSDVLVVMVNYARGAYGAEAYRSYIANVRWCRPIQDRGPGAYSAGVQIMKKSHEIPAGYVSGLNQACDICGDVIPWEKLISTGSGISLCPRCHKHMEAFPNGLIKDSIHRFLVGNVI